jgi:pantoate--beta-alanine ligase
MKIIRQKKDLNKLISKTNSFSFIPTMGGLHKGHEILIKKAKKKSKNTFVSIFVNPKQFNSKNDFKTYPRNLKNDIKILKKLKVKFLYCPIYKDVFSFKPENKIYLHSFSKKLCGKYRPGHFKGVLDVVNRLLELINPKYIFLGKKDFQQLILIKKHIIKNKIKTSVVPCNTIRDQNHLPYSSRNVNLNKLNKLRASKIFNLIKKEKNLIKRKKNKKINLSNIKKRIFKLGIKKIDYIEAINLDSLQKAKKNDENFNIFSAFYVDKVRLIDNF